MLSLSLGANRECFARLNAISQHPGVKRIDRDPYYEAEAVVAREKPGRDSAWASGVSVCTVRSTHAVHLTHTRLWTQDSRATHVSTWSPCGPCGQVVQSIRRGDFCMFCAPAAVPGMASHRSIHNMIHNS